ncbi:MAG: sigma-E processing peptidase SpoIIGA [Acutalibacteraceae bacterium]
MPVIYLDVLLALNLFIDFLLLSAAARILRIPGSTGRRVLGALLGAACACLIFLPPLPAPLTWLIKLGSAALIVRTAFPWHGAAAFVKQTGVFVLLSALFGGVAYALWFFAAPAGFYVVGGVVYYDVSPLMLTALTVVSYAAVRVWDHLTRKSAPTGHEYRLLIEGDAGSVVVRALYDSGNGLSEPFSGKPVAVVQRSALLPALSPAMAQALSSTLTRQPEPVLAGAAADPAASGRGLPPVRLVPYRAVGGDGLLPAFCPKRMTLTSLLGVGADVTGAYIAVCDRLGRGDYEAILGSELAGAADAGRITAARRHAPSRREKAPVTSGLKRKERS